MSIYLGEKGITSTNANYLANLAKECSKNAEAKLKNISFTDKSVELINGSKKNLLRGLTSAEGIEELIVHIANMNSFCAWMREAIKAREDALAKINGLSCREYCDIKGIEWPEKPEYPDAVQASVILNEMNIKEKNNYLRLEAFASTFGKYIHPDGSVSKAREDALHRTRVPHEVDGDGRDMVIYSYSPSTPIEDVEKTFMELQNKYREYEKQLNAIKFKINEERNKRNTINLQKYKEEYDTYSQIVNKINADMALYINKGREEISNMKIVIPEKLQDTYEYLDSLGKKEKVSKT